MPIHQNEDGTWQWGKSGKKYKNKLDAIKQMQAIFANGYRLHTKKASYCLIYKQAAQQYPSLLLALQRVILNETGGTKNPWIRTTGKNSSAFGPGQMGAILTSNPVFPSDMQPSKRLDAVRALSKLRYQRKQFLKYGRLPNKPGYLKRWDYGGTGDTLFWNGKDSLRNRAGYMDVMRAYFKPIYQRALKQKSIQDFYNTIAQGWHGATSPQQNMAYAKKLQQHILK